MTISVNGIARHVVPETTVSGLLIELGLADAAVAVAVDGAVVPRGLHTTTTLAEGAKVEVIRAVGGG